MLGLGLGLVAAALRRPAAPEPLASIGPDTLIAPDTIIAA